MVFERNFKKCCCCIPLKAGAILLGIFAILSVIFGVINMIVYINDPKWHTLAVACLGLSNTVPALGFLIWAEWPTKINRARYARWYVFGETIGLILYFAFLIKS